MIRWRAIGWTGHVLVRLQEKLVASVSWAPTLILSPLPNLIPSSSSFSPNFLLICPHSHPAQPCPLLLPHFHRIPISNGDRGWRFSIPIFVPIFIISFVLMTPLSLFRQEKFPCSHSQITTYCLSASLFQANLILISTST